MIALVAVVFAALERRDRGEGAQDEDPRALGADAREALELAQRIASPYTENALRY